MIIPTSTCCVCLDDVVNINRCIHCTSSVCENCIIRMIANGHFTCPICRHEDWVIPRHVVYVNVYNDNEDRNANSDKCDFCISVLTCFCITFIFIIIIFTGLL